MNLVVDAVKKAGSPAQLARDLGTYRFKVEQWLQCPSDVEDSHAPLGLYEQIRLYLEDGETVYRVEPVAGFYVVTEIPKNVKAGRRRLDDGAKLLAVDGAPWKRGSRVTPADIDRRNARFL